LDDDEAPVRSLMTCIAGRREVVEGRHELCAVTILDSAFDIADWRHGHGFDHFSDRRAIVIGSSETRVILLLISGHSKDLWIQVRERLG
jgi:hypothetical protein